MFVWGVASAATLLITGPMSYYGMRFLLGVAEAGFFPGVLYYMTFWFTSRQRGRVTASLMASIALSGFIVGPVSGAILRGLDCFHGLRGWQWIFALEGVPAMAMGVLCWLYLDSEPAEARWLTPSEKDLIARQLRDENEKVENGQGENGRARQASESAALKAVLTSLPVWGLCSIYACYGAAFFGVVFWLPTIIKATGVDDPFAIGLLTAIPWGTSVVGMIAIAAYVDRKQNSRKVLMVLSVMSAAGFLLTLVAGSTAVSLLALTIAMLGIMAALPIFWNLPTRLFSGVAAAATIALITSLGNLSGLFAPYIVGWSKDTFGNMNIATYMFIASMLLAVPLLIALPQRVDSRTTA